MNRHSVRGMLRVLCILVVLFLALAQTAPVFAEGEEPAPAPPCEGQDCPAAPESAPPCEGEGCLEQPLDSPVEEAPAAGPESQPPELAQTVDTLSDADAVLLNQDGEAVPLADPQAAELLSADDPWFISGTVKYRFVSGACPPPDPAPALTEVCIGGLGNNTIQSAFDYIRDHAVIPVDKTIYLEGTTFNPTGVITVDGSQPNIASVTKLQGAGSDNLGAAGTYTQINGRILITNMPNGFTLQGLAFVLVTPETLVRADNNGGTIRLQDVKLQNLSGRGVDITNHRGAVELNYLSVPSSGQDAVRVDNTAGSGNVSAFSVSIKNSVKYGMRINTKGSVTLDGVYIFNNAHGGAEITAGKGVTIRNSVFSNNNIGAGLTIQPATRGALYLGYVFAENNQQNNLDLSTLSGSVTLENIQANGSVSGYGILIDNCMDGSTPRCTTTSGTVTLRNITAKGNYSTNILVQANGAVTADQIEASTSSLESGLVIQNQKALSVSSITAKRVTSGNNVGYGISLISRGAITLDSFTAYQNYGNVSLKVEGTTAGVSVKATYYGNSTTYSWTGKPGLSISCNGPVSITNLSASFNTGAGIEVDAGSGSVTITGSPVLGSAANNNDEDGIHVRTKGAITVSNMSAIGNTYEGLSLDNHEGTGTVKITGGVYQSNGNNGIWIWSTGAVTVTNPVSQYNNAVGLLIGNESTRYQPVTVNGGYYDSNSNGIRIYSSGTVTVKGVQAIDNSLRNYTINYGDEYKDFVAWGTDRWNFTVSGSATPTTIVIKSPLSTSATLYDPDGNPLGSGSGTDYTIGSVSLPVDPDPYYVQVFSISSSTPYTIWLKMTGTSDKNVKSMQSNGVTVDNDSGSGSVYVSGLPGLYNNFGDAADSAVYISTNGAVTIANVSSAACGENGIEINAFGAGKAVKLDQINILNARGTGIKIASSGPVTITNPTVSRSGRYGMDISSSGNSNITITGNKTYWNDVSYNTEQGISIFTPGSVSVANLYINNSNYGLTVDNMGGSGPVSLSNLSFGNNSVQDIFLQSHGNVSLTGITAYDSVNAVEIRNIYTTPRTVTIKNLYIASASSLGLDISTSGAVSLNGVSVNNVTAPSAIMVNNASGTSGGITIVNSSVNTSSGTGFYLASNGNVSLTGVYSAKNGGYGIVVDNDDVYVRTITLKDVRVSQTGQEALYLQGLGSITLTNISVENASGTYAVYINNKASVTINRTGSSENILSHNDNYGIYIYSLGAVSIDHLVASDHSTQIALYVRNKDGTGKFTLTNSTFSGNLNAFDVTTTGAVRLDNVVIVSSIYTGGSLVIDPAVTPSLSISRSRFDASHGFGLYVDTYGPVTLNGVSATGNNNGPGIQINSNSSAPVTILSSYGLNQFIYNYQDGLKITTKGKITASGLVARNNGNIGINLISNSTAGDPISVSTATLEYNKYGIYISAHGPVTLNKINAFYNGSGTTGDGIVVLSYGNRVNIYNSYAVANRASGLFISLSGGLLYLSNTAYAGNDRGGGTYDPDLKVVP